MNRHTILIVDDGDSRLVLSEFLQDHGYTTIVAADGREALARLDEAQHLSLILLDLTMPVMSGSQFRAFQRTHRRFSKVPVVILSAHSLAAAEAQWLGTAGVLTKPVDLQEVLTIVRRFCPEASATLA